MPPWAARELVGSLRTPPRARDAMAGGLRRSELQCCSLPLNMPSISRRWAKIPTNSCKQQAKQTSKLRSMQATEKKA
uniref:Uncharacterized protein n=1 Tax=Arundo donax TaxID=35708 RepID=A0A0A8YC01_ARUDO